MLITKPIILDIAMIEDPVIKSAMDSVTDSDGVRQQRQLSAPIKVVLDQDRLKRSFVGLRTPAGSDQSRLPQDLELIRGQQG
jgi:hypothetical protein